MAFVINGSILATMLVLFVGLVFIIAFPDAIKPRGYWRSRIRMALNPFLIWSVAQLRFIYDVLDTLSDRQKLKDILDEIVTGQKSLQLH